MTKTPPLEIHCAAESETVRLTLAGELDIAGAPRVEDAVATSLAEGSRSLILDLSELTFVDSSGLRLFILLTDRAAAEGWSLALTRPTRQPLSVFKITGADKHLSFVEEPSA